MCTCVSDKSWTMRDQDPINTFIPKMVDFWEEQQCNHVRVQRSWVGDCVAINRRRDWSIDAEWRLLFGCSLGEAVYWYLMVGRSGHTRSCSVGLVGEDEGTKWHVVVFRFYRFKSCTVNGLRKDLNSYYSHPLLLPTKP